MGSTFYYYDKTKGRMVEGFPPCKDVKYGQAPYVISDTIQAYYHPAARIWTESKRAIDEMDRACGTITTDKEILPNQTEIRAKERKRHQEIERATEEAIARLDNGTYKVPEHVKHLCDIQDRNIAEATGWDVYNLTGKKNDKRGYKYRGRNRANVRGWAKDRASK